LQDSVKTQIRQGGRPCNSYKESFLGNLSVKEIGLGIHLPKLWSKVKCIVFLRHSVYCSQTSSWI